MSHCDEGTLNSLLDGEIPSSELGPIQQHLDQCPQCRARLGEARKLRDEAFELIGVLEVPESGGTRPGAAAPAAAGRSGSARRRRWMSRLAWAATIVTAVGIGYSAGRLDDSRLAGPVADRRYAPASTAKATPEPAATAAPADSGSAPAPPPRRDAGARRTTNRPAAKERAVRSAPATVARAPEEEPSRERAAAPPAPRDEVAAASRVMPEARKDRARNDLEQLRASPDSAFPKRPAAQGAIKVTRTNPIRTGSADEAIGVLGGSIELVDGLVPARYEIEGPTVRVVYLTAWGPVVLEQRRLETGLWFQLIAPAGSPADSIAAWKSRIK